MEMAVHPQPPQVSNQPAVRSGRLARLLLILGVLVLAGAALIIVRRSPDRGSSAERLALDSLVECRSTYLASRLHGGLMGGSPAHDAHKVLRDLYSVAVRTHAPGAVRRLALMRYTLGDEAWTRDLELLWRTPEAVSPFRVERELALWHEVLAGRTIPTQQAAVLADRIRELNLGWFEHLALAALYTHAHMPGEAADEQDAALRSAVALQTSLSVMALAAVFGTALGLAVIIALFRRPRPWWLTPMPNAPVSPHQASILQAIFGSYLAAYLLLQIAVVQLAHPLARTSPPMRMLASITLTIAWAAIPYVIYRKWGRACGITPGVIGWRAQSPLADVLFGVCGYMIALPVVALATALSSWVFRAFESPIHPALMEFAGSRSTWVHVLLFMQAGCIAPIFEETLFRGILYKALSARIRALPAVLCTSAIFALLHPQLPIGFLGIFLLGAMFNGLVILRGSLLPAVIAHAVNNTMILLLFALILGG